MWNDLKTVLLLGTLTGVALAVGQLLGGQQGLLIAFVFAVFANLGSWWFSDRLVLLATRAVPVDEHNAPGLIAMVADLSRRAELPMPRVYIVPDPQPNAFATGRNPKHGVVAVTQGILRLLPPDELRGVIAHELGHIKNRDTLISAVAATLAGAVSVLANLAQWSLMFGRGDDRDGPNPLVVLATAIFAPLAAMVVQMAISRSREYQADAWAANLIGSGRPLASALRRLHGTAEVVPSHSASNATAHLYIVSPLSGGFLSGLFSTHPAVDERVRRLLAIG